MAKKFFVKNATPTVEKEVFSQDGSSSCILGFDRYTRGELLKVFEEYNKIEQDDNFVQNLTDFISSKIKYIKNVSITSYEVDENREVIDGSETIITISDTRTEINESWSNPKECKQLTLSVLFDSFSWGSEIFIKAFNDYIEELTKTRQEVETKN